MAKRANKAPLSDRIGVRIEPQLRAAMDHAAAAERRPLANLIRNILADYVANGQRRLGATKHAGA